MVSEQTFIYSTTLLNFFSRDLHSSAGLFDVFLMCS